MKHRSLRAWCLSILAGGFIAILWVAVPGRGRPETSGNASRLDPSPLFQVPAPRPSTTARTTFGHKPSNLVALARQARWTRDTAADADRIARQVAAGLRTRTADALPAAAPLSGQSRGGGFHVRSPEQQRAIARLRAQLGPDGIVQMDAIDGTVRQIRGRLEVAVAHTQAFLDARDRRDHAAMAVATLSGLGEVLGLRQPEAAFVPRAPETDALGMVHVRLDQQHAGLPIFGAQLVAHFDAAGSPVEVNGVYAPAPRDPAAPRFQLDEAAALQRARDAVQAVGDGLRPPRIERLFYWSPNVAPVAAYAVDLVPSATQSWKVIVAASNGRVLRRLPTTYQAAAVGQATDLLGHSGPLYCWQEGGDFLAIDTTLPMYDAARSRPPSFTNIFGAICIFDVQQKDVDEALKQGISYARSAQVQQWDPTVASMLSHFRRIDAYYRATHQRNSFDDRGISYTGLIHARFKNSQGQLYNDNAYFTPALNVMVFGDGENPPGMLPAGLDIVAHELSHGVVDNSAAFRYENQSGALHEHMADFFACMIDREDWLLGEDTVTDQFEGWRDIANPGNPRVRSPSPRTMAEYENLPNTPEGDLGGVHVNSTIPSHATYLCAEGPAGIGRDKVERIVYRALTKYLTQYATFVDYRRAMLSAAADLYPGGSEPTAVAQAFDAVQILDGQGSPPPTPVPATQGEERAAFLRAEYDPFLGFFLGYGLYVVNAQGYQLVTENPLLRTRPAVSGDGTWALYVGEDSNVYWTDGETDEPLTDSFDVRTIAMSKDLRFVAFTTTDYDNQVYLLDTTSETVRAATIRVPTSGDPVVASFADVLAFNCTGDVLYFDAFTEGILQQAEYGIWGLYAMRVKDLQCQSLLPLSPGLQIGNPATANTRPDLLVADYEITEQGRTTIGAVILDLNRNDLRVLFNGLETYASPSFRGDDQRLVYTTLDDGLFHLNEAALSADHTTLVHGSEVPILWSMSELVYPVGFRTGTYSAPAAVLTLEPAALDFGSVASGSSARRSIQIANTGNADLELLAVTLEGAGVEAFDFASSLDARLAAGQRQTLDLSFNPGAAGNHAATLHFKSSAPNAADVTVALTGIATAAPPKDYWHDIWQDFQDHYSYFEYKSVNWPAVYEAHRTAFQGLAPAAFGQKLNQVLQVLHDWHVYVGLPDGTYIGYQGDVPRNYPNKLYPAYAGGTAYTDVRGAHVLYHNRLTGNWAHLVIDTLDTQAFQAITEADLDAVLASHADADGWILDLRGNAGGNEANAARFAARLVQQPVTFGHVRYRKAGSVPYAFDDWIPKVLQPAAGKPPYLKPVVGLIGRRCMSSAEWFTLMLRACPNAVLIGDQTRGASGSPVSRTIPELQIEYAISTWIAYDENRQPFEDRGIAPAIAVAPGASFDEAAQKDFVLEKAIAYLDWRKRYGAQLPTVSARTDADRDGIPDVAEFVAGTDPLAGGTAFGFRPGGLRRLPWGGLDLEWTGPTGRRFHLERASSVTGPFQRIAENLTAGAGVNSYEDATATGSGPYFYRLAMEP